MLKKSLFLLLVLSTTAFSTKAKIEVDRLQKMLNSERIEAIFGSYGVDVLPIQSSVFPGSRIANLYSLHNGQKVTRTLAVVDYVNPVHKQVESIHAKILAGESIGTAFKNAGWKLTKEPLLFGDLALQGQIKEMMKNNGTERASVHIYDLKVEKTEQIPYCRIIEIHNPEYINFDLLKALHPNQAPKMKVQEGLVLLGKLKKLLDELSHPHK